MSVITAKEELHAIVDSLEASEVPFALRLMRSLSQMDTKDVQSGTPSGAAGEHHPWFGIIGMIDDDGPTDMSVNHDAYLADA